jgi:hypothetical protein
MQEQDTPPSYMLLCELIFKPHTHSLARGARRLFQNCCSESFGACVCVLLSLHWLEINFYLASHQVPARRQKGLVLKIAPVKGFALFFPPSREQERLLD